ncbi:MAG: hypothetical protein M3325_06905, partial [Actinomycetota bacterium]|nr:hypothetical protein [Actinomycetota bacterium]
PNSFMLFVACAMPHHPPRRHGSNKGNHLTGPLNERGALTPVFDPTDPRPQHIEVVLVIHSDPRACAHNPSDALRTRANAEAQVQRWTEHWYEHGGGYWAISQEQSMSASASAA